MRMRKEFYFFLKPLWVIYDFLVAKRADYWAFSTHHLHAGRFIENQRAVFECIKDREEIKKIIFYRGALEDFQIENAINYELVEHGTWRGMWLLARCKVVFLTHSISMDFSLRWGGREFSILPILMKRRAVVNLWHAISLKRLYYTANAETRLHTDRIRYRNRERAGYAGLIASSDVDSYAMASMFYPLNYLQVWRTGLPRNDFLTCPEGELPKYIRDSLERLRQIAKKRRIVVYAPTYRQTLACESAYYYQFSDDEIDRLKELMRRHNAVFAYRPHYFENDKNYFNLNKYIDNDCIVDISMAEVQEFSAVARECDLLITDYSSVYIEALYLKKPAICFAYDMESYMKQQDGLLYDLNMIFPGEICEKFNALLEAIEKQLIEQDEKFYSNENLLRKLFFTYCDGNNSQRVVDRVIEYLKL